MVLIFAFIAFWVVYAVWFGIREANKIASDYPGIKKDGVLRVCGEEDLFSFYKNNDTSYGFYYEMAKAFADRHHLQLVYMGEPSLNNRLKMLQDNKFDILSGPLSVIMGLRNQVDFTKSIIESKLVLVQRKSSENNPDKVVRNQVDFRGKRIYICENTAYEERLHHLASEISDTLYIQTLMGFNSERMIAQVAAGLIDYAVCDKQVAKSFRNKYPNIDVETPVGFNQMQAWAVKPDKKILLDSLNQFIVDFKKTPEFTKLIQKYIAN